jgi:phosphoserine phosphatase
MSNRLRPAVFTDLEGTLITCSFPQLYYDEARALSLIPFSNQILHALFSSLAQPFSVKSRLGRALRYLAMASVVRNMPVSANHAIMQRVIPRLQASLRTELFTRIRHYESQGIPVIVLSAASHLPLTLFTHSLGWRGEGTHFVVRNERYTGRADKPLTGEEKAARARSLAVELGIDLKQSIGFGDTVADVPFLSLLKQVTVVHPDRELRQIAITNGWEILENMSSSKR